MRIATTKPNKSTLTTLICAALFGLTSHTMAASDTTVTNTTAPIAAHTASHTLDTHIEQLLAEHHLPGLVLMVKHQNKLVHYNAYGKVNVKKPKPMTKDALFRIFSMSKPITSVALLQLVDRGQIDLADDIRKFLPELDVLEVDGQPHTVTIHHLLSHTAGFGYGGGLKSWVDIRYLLANPLSRGNTLDEMIDDLSGIDLKFTPGERFEYSIASDIQGAIIEKVSGLPLDTYLTRYLFEPLNMQDTHFSVPKGSEHRLVDMYEYDATTFEEAYVFNKDKILFSEEGADSDYLNKPVLLSGGGGLISTAQDYSNFVSMLSNQGKFNGQTLLSEHLVNTMLSTKTQGLDTHFMPRVYKGVGFGYGVGVKETAGDLRQEGTFFWGGMGGTIFWSDPKSQLEVVAMMQVEDGWVALEKWLIPHIYTLIDAPQIRAQNAKTEL
ncbi:beta-lactamase family protein [Pseudoalteromonas sp. DL2-H2.2]|uniref:serine hydrolase domain-containing protein n=1 Tax=Pseudoalteromonas sp. DL2-H2.2 TaxID=2908889 RepID=UPI001F3A0E92|nr:serine hydrolase domain-containing protein [Pseudoalteromonas sp. DL2-H2.2]MCF2907495.1 beta-lactamase family protein [Pseudoalteromonas sp. DL2-H2.2]